MYKVLKFLLFKNPFYSQYYLKHRNAWVSFTWIWAMKVILTLNGKVEAYTFLRSVNIVDEESFNSFPFISWT